MVTETLVDFLFQTLNGAFAVLDFVGLPMDFINVLQSILCYGIWVVGADLMAIIVGSIVAWWGAKFIVGLLVFVWELIPFT